MSKRRLVAIMFTDIEGYTALMQKSEQEALRFRDTHRKIFNSNTEEFNGEIIQYYGDGTLSIFESAVDAVQCGIAMQRAFQKDSRIPVRIGIHSGDIVISEEDIIGDGVNIASRVESLAVAGSVFISDKVYDEVKNSDVIQTSFLDKFKLKNVTRPVGVYAISNEGLVVPPRKAITGKLEKENPTIRWILTGLTVVLLLLGMVWVVQNLLAANREQTIVLLPPNNYTGREDLDYLVEGVYDLLYGDLCKVSSKLRVISPFTARALKNAGKSIPEMAAEVNADFFLETSVSCMDDNNMCINTRLLEVDSEERQIWAQDYYEKKGEILNFNHFLVKKIAGDINVHLTPEVEIAMASSRPVDTSALDLYLRGQFYLDQVNPASLEKAADYFNQAVEKDPNWAPPYAGLAMVVSYQIQMDYVSPAIGIPKLHEYLPTALELDPYSSQAYLAKAISAVWAEWNWEKGETAFLESLRRDPNDPLCRMFYAHLLTILRRNEEALQQGELAQELDPQRPLILGLYGMVLIDAASEYEAALTLADKAFSIDSDHYFAKHLLWQVCEHLGEYEKAFEMTKEFNINLWEDYGVTTLFEKVFRERGWIAFKEEQIRVSEEIMDKDGRLIPWGHGNNYFLIRNFDKAMDYFEKAWHLHDPDLPYISASLYYNEMKDNPKYRELLKKMKLPTQ